MHETTDQIRAVAQARSRLKRRPTRTPTRFEVWAWSPIVVLRVALVTTYLLYVYFGIISFIAGIPAFTLTAPQGYTSVWATLLVVASVISAVGAIEDRWNRVERWASLALSSLMLGYVGTINVIAWISGLVDRQAVAAAVAIGFVLPVCRFVYLASQAGKKKAAPE